MKLAIVIQRFGSGLTGGAEYHARRVAQHLAQWGHDVTVLTSTAQDARRWTNFYNPGLEIDGLLRVLRFPIASNIARNFERVQETVRILLGQSPVQLQQNWTTWANPFVPELIKHIKHISYDAVFFFTYSYFPSLVGALHSKSYRIGVPLAHDEPEFYSPVVHRMLQNFNTIITNTIEEKELIQKVLCSETIPTSVPIVTAGCGVDPPPNQIQPRPIEQPYVVYLGRAKDGTEILQECWRYFQSKYANEVFLVGSEPKTRMVRGSEIQLVTVGDLNFEKRATKNWIVKGHVTVNERWAWCAHAEVLINPSLYESLALTLLEAWWVQRPVLARAQCRVMANQVARAQGGSTFMNPSDFADKLAVMLRDPQKRAHEGRLGQTYAQSHYSWAEVMKHYQRVLHDVKPSL